MVIIGSYHKTGSVLFKAIWDNYSKDKEIKHCNNFFRISDDEIKGTKCVVIIRHPMEIIMSGVRYHQTTTEKWCNIPDEKYNNKTYKEYLKNLSEDDKIIFEMDNIAYNTITNIYNDVKNRNFNNNILFIKIEDLYDEKNIPIICEKIQKHLDSSIKIDINKLEKSFSKCLKISYHRTNTKNEYTYNKYFNSEHIEYFNKLFPEDTLEVLGYKI